MKLRRAYQVLFQVARLFYLILSVSLDVYVYLTDSALFADFGHGLAENTWTLNRQTNLSTFLKNNFKHLFYHHG